MKTSLRGFSEFSIGCNYWSSRDGVSMWRNWDERVVDGDFAAMHEYGMNTVRVFPLWSDFQPVKYLCECAGDVRELAFVDGTPLPKSGPGQYGLSEMMLERFRIMADLALKHELKLVVGLLTGWMSGAMFLPQALENRNLFTDFAALRLEVMFIRGFVNEFKDHPAIVAWEPGNECNCLARSTGVDCCWNWLNTIASAIRLADPSRPVCTGMHGAKNNPRQGFNLQMQGELFDVLTTHPYPAFTPFCGRSALNNIPAVYHATAETLYYSGCSGKPAFIEEIGAFGPGYLSDERTEAYLYTQLYSAWAHDLGSVLWWCGFSFDRCSEQYPYRWVGMERELGAFKGDRTPLGAARAAKRFADELKALEFDELPPRQIDAVVIASENPEMWRAAYGSFILSKQAGFEIKYCTIDNIDELPESDFYLLPAIDSYWVMDLQKYRLLLQKVEQGATLCVTADSGMLNPFVEVFSCGIDFCTESPATVEFTLDGNRFSCTQSKSRQLKAAGCDVVAQDDAGNPQIIVNKYGKGKLIYCNVAPEPDAWQQGNNYFLLYRKFAQLAGLTLPEKAPETGVTRHVFADGRVLEFRINYADHEVEGIGANRVKLTWL